MTQTKKFLPRKRKHIGKEIWGYKVDSEDRYLLHPLNDNLLVLEEGFDYLDQGASFRKTADWVTSQTGSPISPQTLRNRYNAAEDREEGRVQRAKLVSNYTKPKKKKRLNKEQKQEKKIKATESQLQRDRRKLEEIKGTLPKDPKDVVLPAESKPEIKQVKIAPNPGPQTDFLSSSEDEVLYGGQAGGGKSFAITVDPLRTVHLRSHRAITFRRTNDELRQLIWMSKQMYPDVVPGAKWKEADKTWEFPSGGTHWFRYLDREDDVLGLQGQDFTHVYWDELTQWPTPFAYDYMRSRIRSTDPEISPFMGTRSTTNPGGPGHGWVKRMFVDPAPPNTPFPGTDIETGEVLLFPPEHKRAGEIVTWRRYIPAQLKDNPYLYDDGRYEANLLSLPETQRRQLYEGNWDVAGGAAFSEFRRNLHTCDPFEIPKDWPRFRTCDWGFEAPACCLWIAIDPDGKLWVYRELYTKRMLANDFADKVMELEQGENVAYGVLDSSTWHKRGDGGPSVAEILNKRGCGFRPSDRSAGSRISGKLEIHRRLKVEERQNPATGAMEPYTRLTIFNNCVNLIRTLPSIPLDKTKHEDVDTKAEDHAYDALRYGCASRPINMRAFMAANTTSQPDTDINPVNAYFG